MNKTVLSMPLALAIAVIALVSIGCARSPDTNVNSSPTTSRNSTSEPVDTVAIEAELIKIEKEWADAMKNKDAATVRRILADNIVLTYPDGSTGTKDIEVQMAETGAFTADSWDMVDPKVTVLDANAAIITGRTVVKNGKLKDAGTQQTIDISGEYRFMDVYAKRNGTWQAVASQVTKIQQQPQKQ